MSLVEQALKKMQATRAPEAARVSAAPATNLAAREPGPARAESPMVARRSIRLNMDALRVAGFLSPTSQEKQLANQYRQIKRPLIANALGRGGVAKLDNGNLIMVTSSLPGDGKTFTSINLALSMAAEVDLPVVLVDTDVAKRHISELLGLGDATGLLDVLRNESLDVEACIVDTDIPGLSVLSAGKFTENATELLASPRMEQVVRQLGSASERRIVLFDSPPLLLTSESRVLAASMGQIALVICAESTPQRAVLDALDLLGEGKPVSAILNQSQESERGDYSYYGYGNYGERTSSGDAT
jgi:protein-tyrosine kinase